MESKQIAPEDVFPINNSDENCFENLISSHTRFYLLFVNLSKKNMQKDFNIQYLTDDKGRKTAVQIPFKEWGALINELNRLKHLNSLKNDLKEGLMDLLAVEKGNSKEISLTDFLNDN